MPAHFDLHHVVSGDEIDAQNHVHNLRYLQWTLWAARDHAASRGWDAASQLRAGFGWVVRSHDVTYRAAAVAGDAVVIRTWISELTRFASRRRYVICRPADRVVLAKAETRWVYVDLRIHRAVAVPDDAVAAIDVVPTPPPLPWELSS